MKRLCLWKWVVVLAVGFVFAVGCSSVRVGRKSETIYRPAPPGPPPHAPAHGYRKKYAYRYYPSRCVYFDVERQLYFYLQGDQWSVGASLPASIVLDPAEAVVVEVASDTPYVDFEVHRVKYPPGYSHKAKEKGPGKARGKKPK